MSSYLPFEIQVEIVKRLPAKSLIRFQSVCKAWKSFIRSSEFIDHYNACRPEHRLLVTYRDYNYKEKCMAIVDDDTFPLHKLSHTIPSSVNLLNVVAIFGSSQGLFCYYGYMEEDPMAVIWNPSIRKSVDIVVSSKLNRRMYKLVVGFGVCPRTFDPMLVKITYIKIVDTIADYTPTRVEVFTLSSGAWKSRSINLPRESIRFTQDYSMDLDGFIYWLAIDEGETGRYNMIMSFDMTSENFIEITLPDSLVGAHYGHLSISKRMESLVVLEYNFIAKKQLCIVWMMEGGVHKSFTKLFTIKDPTTSIRRVLGFRKSGEPIIRRVTGYRKSSEPIIAMDKNGSCLVELGVFLYEPSSRHISYIGISEKCLRLASSYTETLLLLDR